MTDRIESHEFRASGGLEKAYQVAKVIIKLGDSEKDSKLGLEIRLIPKTEDEERAKRFKPRSFFVNRDEIRIWDMLIFEMIKFRFKFTKREKMTNVDYQDLIDVVKEYYLKRLREAVEEGLKY
jgi:hypothetical protein